MTTLPDLPPQGGRGPAVEGLAPHQLTIRAAGDAIASGSLTPTHLVEALLARIEALEPRVRAWCHVDVDGARKQAAALTAEAGAGRVRGPLHGIPFGVKDIFHVQGMPTGVDTGVPAGYLQPEDAAAVARLREAGAVVVGKLEMPGPQGRPPTRNPWDLERTPGGSSSGSGAAVGALMVPFSLGEQTAGSGLRPAAYCGACALKPTFGRISRYRMLLNAWSLDHVVAMARTMEDVRLLYGVLAGPDPRDVSTLGFGSSPPLRGSAPPSIGVLRQHYKETAEPAMLAAEEAALQRLAKAGADIREAALPAEFDYTWPAHGVIMAAERTAVRAHIVPSREAGPRRAAAAARQAWGKAVMLPEELGAYIPGPYYVQARRLQRWFRGRLLGLFDQADILVTPTAQGAAPLFKEGSGDNSYLIPWSLVGYPALTVPCGLSPEGMPLGLQLIARPQEDEALLQAGAWFEKVLGPLPAVPLG